MQRQPLTVTASVRGGGDDVTPTFNWTLSDAVISIGQGTSTITVDTAEQWMRSGSTTATVDVGGYDRVCNTSASSTTYARIQPKPRKIDEYGTLKPVNAHARIDNYAIEMQNDPTAQAYVIAYGGRTSTGTAAQKTADKAKTYLVMTRGIDASRIVTVNGGFREKPFTELWIVPSDAPPPTASPTLDPSEIKPPKKRSKKTLAKNR
jgi:hypothetical protein